MKRDIETCSLCDEPLLPGEHLSSSLFNGRQVHHECAFRAVIGGVNHILKNCTCCGGTEPPDPPWMSKRAAAQAAVAAWVRLQDNPELLDLAKKISHEHRQPWRNPITGVTYPPPKLP